MVRNTAVPGTRRGGFRSRFATRPKRHFLTFGQSFNCGLKAVIIFLQSASRLTIHPSFGNQSLQQGFSSHRDVCRRTGFGRSHQLPARGFPMRLPKITYRQVLRESVICVAQAAYYAEGSASRRYGVGKFPVPLFRQCESPPCRMLDLADVRDRLQDRPV